MTVAAVASAVRFYPTNFIGRTVVSTIRNTVTHLFLAAISCRTPPREIKKPIHVEISRPFPARETKKPLEGTDRGTLVERIRALVKALGMSISSGVEVKEAESESYLFGASASRYLGEVTLTIQPSIFDSFTDGEQEFVIAHELAHIKSNDTMGSMQFHIGAFIVQGVAQAIICPPAISMLALLGYQGVNFIIHNIATSFFARWHERRADEIAFSVCSEKGREGGVTHYRKMSIIEEKGRDSKRPFRQLFRDSVDFVLGRRDHPAMLTRIQYLQDWISKAKAETDDNAVFLDMKNLGSEPGSTLLPQA